MSVGGPRRRVACDRIEYVSQRLKIWWAIYMFTTKLSDHRLPSDNCVETLDVRTNASITRLLNRQSILLSRPGECGFAVRRT